MNLRSEKIMKIFKKAFSGSDYYKKIMSMSYKEALNFLKEKNGKVMHNYFLDDEFKKINKNNFVNKYIIHHDFSNEVIFLDKPIVAKQFPTEYQESKNLTYCTLIEYLLLNLLIMLEAELEFKDEKIKITLGYNNVEKILSKAQFIMTKSNQFKFDKLDLKIKKVLKKERLDFVKVMSAIFSFLTFSTLFKDVISTPLYSATEEFDDYKNEEKFLEEILPEIRIFLDNFDDKLLEEGLVYDNKNPYSHEYLKYLLMSSSFKGSFTYLRFLDWNIIFDEISDTSLAFIEYNNLFIKQKNIILSDPKSSKYFNLNSNIYDKLHEMIKQENEYLEKYLNIYDEDYDDEDDDADDYYHDMLNN